MEGPIDTKFGTFFCSIEWHLSRLGPTCALIYPFALRLSRNSCKFAASASSIAGYFEISLRNAQRAFRELRDAGFFELVESGKASFEPSVFRVLMHREWAEKNPGMCVEKLTYAWTDEGDPLGRRLYAVSGGQVQFQPCQVDAIRRLGLQESEVISRFESWYPRHKADKWGKKWRKSVGYHFLMYLRERTEIPGPAAAEEVNHHA